MNLLDMLGKEVMFAFDTLRQQKGIVKTVTVDNKWLGVLETHWRIRETDKPDSGARGEFGGWLKSIDYGSDYLTFIKTDKLVDNMD